MAKAVASLGTGMAEGKPREEASLGTRMAEGKPGEEETWEEETGSQGSTLAMPKAMPDDIPIPPGQPSPPWSVASSGSDSDKDTEDGNKPEKDTKVGENNDQKDKEHNSMDLAHR